MGEYDKIKTNYAIFKKTGEGEVSKMQNSRFLISSISKFVQFSKTSNSLRAAPTSVRFLREKTPIGKLEELEGASHPFQEKEPLAPFPGGVNPKTGEVGGPKGPEPTRFGDWERKGRVTDF